MDIPPQLSPELALVDPELAAWARARLPVHAVTRPNELRPPLVVRPAEPHVPAHRLARAFQMMLLFAILLFALLVVTAAAAHEVRAADPLATLQLQKMQ